MILSCPDDLVLPRTGSDEPASGVTPCWTGVEGCDVYEGDIVLPRNGFDEPVPGVTPCQTGVKECAMHGADIVLPQTGSDEPAPGVMPCRTGVEKCDIYESVVASCRTGSDQIINNVVSTVDPGGPGHGTGLVMVAPGDVLVMSSECWEDGTQYV